MAGRADVTYVLSGTLGVDDGGTSGVAGGTFAGTYSVAGLPGPSGTTLTVDAFEVAINNAMGSTVYTISSANAGASGQIEVNPGGGGIDILGLSDSAANLQLLFADPFNGTGAAITSGTSVFTSFFGESVTSPTGSLEVLSATSGLPGATLPEPSSLATDASSAGGLGLARRRRRGGPRP